MASFPDLRPVLDPLRWAVAGAVATRLYMPERVTHDLDIIVRSADASEVRKRLGKAGYRYHGELSTGVCSWVSPDRKTIDVVESSEGWIDEALVRAQANQDAQGLPILPLPYLVLMKFEAGRVQDLADVTRMLGQADQKMLETIRQLFATVLPGEMEDLESLITLGKLEMEG